MSWRMRAEHNCIVAPPQKFEHGIVNRRQWKLFPHGKLLKCKSPRIEHAVNITLRAACSPRV